MSNIKFQNALKRVAQDVPPVWLMRQAGRYHSHYRKLREKHDFATLCRQPELAAEVAMGPIQEFDFDVAILFSDILFPLEALGFGLRYDPAPQLDRRLSTENVLDLRSPQEALPHLEFQKKAMQCTRQRLPNNKSLIGFVGGPWTLFTYATQGAHKGPLSTAKTQTGLYRQFAEILLPLLAENIRMQLEGGAELVMIFDTAAGELSPGMFRQIVEPDLNRLAIQFSARIGYYSKGTQASHLQRLWSEGEFAGLGFDHRWDLSRLFGETPRGFLQGNFDESLLFAEPGEFKKLLEQYLRPFTELTGAQRAGWVCGLGHGVLPETPEKNVKYFVERVRETFS